MHSSGQNRISPTFQVKNNSKAEIYALTSILREKLVLVPSVVNRCRVWVKWRKLNAPNTSYTGKSNLIERITSEQSGGEWQDY